MTTTQSRIKPLEIVERFFEAYARGSLSEIEAHMAPTVRWRLSPGHPFSPTDPLVGRAEVLRYLAAINRIPFKVDRLFAGGDERVAVDIHTVRLETFEMTSATFFTIDNAQIVEVLSLAEDPESWAALLRERL